MSETTISARRNDPPYPLPDGDTGTTVTATLVGAPFAKLGYDYETYKRERPANNLAEAKEVGRACVIPTIGMFDSSGVFQAADSFAHGKYREGVEKFVLKKLEHLGGPFSEGLAKFKEGMKIGVECDAKVKDIADRDATRQATYLRNEQIQIRQLKLDLDAGLISKRQYDLFTSKMSAPSQHLAKELKDKQFDETEANLAKAALPAMKKDFAMGANAAYGLGLRSPADVKARCDADPAFKGAYEGNFEFRVGVDKVVDDYANDRASYDAKRPAPPAPPTAPPTAQPAAKK